MCKCRPEIRTPFCGVGDCVWPDKKEGLIMKYLLEVETYSNPGVKEYVVDVFSEEEAKKMMGNRIVLSGKSNAIRFDNSKDAEEYVIEKDVLDIVTIIQEEE